MSRCGRNLPPSGVSGDQIPEPVRSLLAAVLEAIAIPFPAMVGDRQAYASMLIDRATYARVVLERVLAQAGPPVVLAWEVDWLCGQQLATRPPVGYQHHALSRRDRGGRS